MGCLASSPSIINVWCGTSVLLLVVQTPCFAMFNIILSLSPVSIQHGFPSIFSKAGSTRKDGNKSIACELGETELI